jgi:5-methylcytosine-specific restriction endonuclease McrA
MVWAGKLALPTRDQPNAPESMSELSQTRLCPNCGAEQEWFVGKNHSQWICRPCRRETTRRHARQNKKKLQEYRKAYYKANKEKCNAASAKWRAEVLTPEMQSQYDRRSYLKHQAKRKAKARRWRQENPMAHDAQKGRRRAALRDSRTGPTPQWAIEERFALWGKECAYCGKHHQEMDHFVPLNKGGPHCIENIVPCCRSCNASKKDKLAWNWYSVQDFFAEERWEKLLEHTQPIDDVE